MFDYLKVIFKLCPMCAIYILSRFNAGRVAHGLSSHEPIATPVAAIQLDRAYTIHNFVGLLMVDKEI